MDSVKAQARDLIESLPSNVDWDELISELLMLRELDRNTIHAAHREAQAVPDLLLTI